MFWKVIIAFNYDKYSGNWEWNKSLAFSYLKTLKMSLDGNGYLRVNAFDVLIKNRRIYKKSVTH